MHSYEYDLQVLNLYRNEFARGVSRRELEEVSGKSKQTVERWLTGLRQAGWIQSKKRGVWMLSSSAPGKDGE